MELRYGSGTPGIRNVSQIAATAPIERMYIFHSLKTQQVHWKVYRQPHLKKRSIKVCLEFNGIIPKIICLSSTAKDPSALDYQIFFYYT